MVFWGLRGSLWSDGKVPLLAWLLGGPPRPGKSNGLAEGQEASVLVLMRQLPDAPFWAFVVGRSVGHSS